MMKTAYKDSKVTGLLVLVVLTLALGACTKSRDAEVADEDVELQLIPKAELESDNYSMKLGSDVGTLDFKGKPLAVNEKPTFKSRDVNAPAKLVKFLSNIPVQGKAGEALALKFKVTPTLVFVMKRVDNIDDVAAIDRGLIEEIRGIKYQPLYSIPVLGLGVLINNRTDNGERSYKQSLRATSLKEATHVQLDLRAEKIIAVEIPRDQANYLLRREIFRSDDLKNKIYTASEITDLLQVDLTLPNPSEKVYTRLELPNDPSSSLVTVQIYTITKISQIEDPEIKANLKKGIGKEVLECPADVKQASGNGDDCALILAREVDGFARTTTLARGENGFPTGSVTIEHVPSSQNVSLIHIQKNTLPAVVGPDRLRSFSPDRTIRVADIKGREFLLRRTMEEAASTLATPWGPGFSGDTDIVTFSMEKDRLVVRRVETVNAQPKASDIDREELMSLPAAYFQTKDDTGRTLSVPRRASQFNADIIVVDWTNNTVDDAGSLMGLFAQGQCFTKVGSKTVADMDMRLNEGVLNFSLAGTYAFQPMCWNYVLLGGYAYSGATSQTNYNIRERISFRVHNKEDDKKFNQDLAFDAQNRMGFGVFTMDRRVADKFGNFGTLKTEVAHPVIQDFTNGKILTYHLGGLPSDPKYRKIFIDTTKQVVADWNEAMHKAFRGTSLQRDGIYVELKVDGEDGVTHGRLGDLDRNYIWNFDKVSESSPLGLSQAAPNPRTGIIVANNVLMYSGALMSYIGSSKEAAALLKRYNEARKQAELKGAEDFKKELEEAAAQNKQLGAATFQGEITEQNAGKLMTQGLVRRWSDMAKGSAALAPRTPMMTPQSAQVMGQKVARVLKTSTEANKDSKEVAYNSLQEEKAYLRNVIDKAVQMKAFKDPTLMNALTAAEILKAYGDKLEPFEREALEAQARTMALRVELAKHFQKRSTPGCIMSADGIPEVGYWQIAETDVETLFANWYADVLSHEMGHSFGLTHNFRASYDKKNHKFAEEPETESRAYSSVMDYMAPEDTNYRKPGPYDIHAMRAAYTGLVEIGDDVKKEVDTVLAGQKAAGVGAGTTSLNLRKKGLDGEMHDLTVYPGNLVKISQLKDIMLPVDRDMEGKPFKSWFKLDGRGLSLVPLKNYHYCTDKDVGEDPTCNRWDFGTTPTEVVQRYIKEYNKMYPLRNNRWNKLRLTGLGDYISRLYGTFYSIRSFMDDSFYRAIRGGYPDVNDFFMGALEGYKFFLNVYNTPQSNADFLSPEHFVRVNYEKVVPKLDADGKPVLDAQGQPVTENVPAFAIVEAKQGFDTLTPGSNDSFDIKTRGVEYDKAIALMMLTNRGLSSRRMDGFDLNLSFAEFEKWVLGMDANSSLMLRNLRDALAENSTASLLLPGAAGLAPVGLDYAPEMTSLVRYFTIVSAAVSLEANTLEDKDNFAALFRVGSTLNASVPQDRYVVTKADTAINSSGGLKYWALDNAGISGTLVRDAAQKRVFIDNAPAVTNAMIKLLIASSNKNNAAGKDKGAKDDDHEALVKAHAEAVALLNKLNVNGVLFNQAEQAQGLNAAAYVNYTAQQIMTQIQQVAGTYNQMRQMGMSDAHIVQLSGQMLGSAKKSSELNVKNLPILAIAGDVLKAVFQQSQPHTAIVTATAATTDELKSNYGFILSNIETLNTITGALHPELNR